jgi:division protein CdvB (Snf7/Vps24/ESCRT-III family)
MMDDMLEDEFEDEESDQVLDQVLDEIGLDLNTSVRHTHTSHAHAYHTTRSRTDDRGWVQLSTKNPATGSLAQSASEDAALEAEMKKLLGA